MAGIAGGFSATTGELGDSRQVFYETSRLLVSARGAVNSGLQIFYGSSRLETAEGDYEDSGSGYQEESYIVAGEQRFYEQSTLEANVAESTGSFIGQQSFYDESALNANVQGPLAKRISMWETVVCRIFTIRVFSTRMRQILFLAACRVFMAQAG